MCTNDIRVKILLAAQASLLGEIFPSIRKITIDWTENSISLIYHVSSELSEEDTESVSIIETVMYSHLPEFEITSIIITPSSPLPVTAQGVVIFAVRPENME